MSFWELEMFYPSGGASVIISGGGIYAGVQVLCTLICRMLWFCWHLLPMHLKIS